MKMTCLEELLWLAQAPCCPTYPYHHLLAKLFLSKNKALEVVTSSIYLRRSKVGSRLRELVDAVLESTRFSTGGKFLELFGLFLFNPSGKGFDQCHESLN